MLFSLEGSRSASAGCDFLVQVGMAARRPPTAYLENCIAAVGVLYISGQDIKGTRWMPWRQKPMKDVDGCDKPR